MIYSIKSFFILLSFCFLFSCRQGTSTELAEVAPIDTIAELTEQIQHCSRLYTTEYQVHKIVACESDRSFEGFGFRVGLNLFGDRKVIIPMDATLKGYIDFSLFSAESIERNGQQLVVTLPDPEVMLTSTRIDHDGVKEFVTGFRHPFSDEELTNFEMQGRQAIIDEIPRLGIEKSAREGAARLLLPLFRQMGFHEQDIVICFRHDYSPIDLKRKLE